MALALSLLAAKWSFHYISEPNKLNKPYVTYLLSGRFVSPYFDIIRYRALYD